MFRSRVCVCAGNVASSHNLWYLDHLVRWKMEMFHWFRLWRAVKSTALAAVWRRVVDGSCVAENSRGDLQEVGVIDGSPVWKNRWNEVLEERWNWKGNENSDRKMARLYGLIQVWIGCLKSGVFATATVWPRMYLAQMFTSTEVPVNCPLDDGVRKAGNFLMACGQYTICEHSVFLSASGAAVSAAKRMGYYWNNLICMFRKLRFISVGYVSSQLKPVCDRE